MLLSAQNVNVRGKFVGLYNKTTTRIEYQHPMYVPKVSRS